MSIDRSLKIKGSLIVDSDLLIEFETIFGILKRENNRLQYSFLIPGF